MKPARRRRRWLTHTRRVLLIALGALVPAVVVAVAFSVAAPITPRLRWTLAAGIVLAAWAMLAALAESVSRPLQTLGNLIGALREEDFSFRARTDGSQDPLNLAFVELNALAATLREERLGALEASALLRKVLAEIDVAVLAFDSERKLRLTNRAGERLLGMPSERLIGLGAGELGLSDVLVAGAPRVVDLALPTVAGRFEVRHGTVRQGGRPVDLLVLSDLSRALREEERQAWQRLIRVLGHELNNSLTPIRSVTSSLEDLLSRDARPADWEDDLRRGLALVGARAAALSRFMDGYARLARLPPPERTAVSVGDLVRRAVRLETRVRVDLREGPAVEVEADADQIEQALINLLRNAADASLETGGGVRVGWEASERAVAISVEDEGHGLPPRANLFVPFFTTKPQGSGIGLVLSRQIAEGHGGSLVLENRDDGPGCVARLRLSR
jgi:two-component system, NtrC family, nitrogen regulation sensor histidine kinase NtrY